MRMLGRAHQRQSSVTLQQFDERQKLMADVMTTLGDQHRIEGATGK
jgi:hypothetical protein